MTNFFSIAPMMGKTDEYFCYLIKLINKDIMVYTEMMHAEAILRTRILDNYDFIKDKSNIAVQIAGNNPITLSEASKEIKKKGFEEININCGCPSPRVVSGSFGISLLLEPDLVKRCVLKIQKNFNNTISIKTRIGIEDYNDNEKLLNNFLKILSNVGIKKFIIHARNAIIGKLQAKDNLKIPTLDYDRVIRLKKRFNHEQIIINGGFKNINSRSNYAYKLDGIMIGRKAYSDPWIFNDSCNDRFMKKKYLINKYLLFLKKRFDNVGFKNNALFHIQKSFNGINGAKVWRKLIDQAIKSKNLECLFEYLEYN